MTAQHDISGSLNIVQVQAREDQEKAIAHANPHLSEPGNTQTAWRASSWYTTFVICLGCFTDVFLMMVFTTVFPFRLQQLQYTKISTLVAWLNVVYAIATILVLFPTAYYFHRYPFRRAPLVLATAAMVASLVLMMVVKPYWALVVARSIQGGASAIVWSVGFALLCENVDVKHKGRQIGIVFAGVSAASIAAPVIGGALYNRLGWYAPCIFTMGICIFDLIARLSVLERNPRKLATTRELEKELSPGKVILTLMRSGRGMTGTLLAFVFGLVMGAKDVAYVDVYYFGADGSLTLHVQDQWHRESSFIGLIYLIMGISTMFAGVIIGVLSDRLGPEWLVAPTVLLLLPWPLLAMFRKSLAGFIVVYCGMDFVLGGIMSLSGIEVAAIAEKIEGISEVHEFAATRMAFSAAFAIASVAGGELYTHAINGWSAVCWLQFACVLAIVPLPWIYSGDRPLLARFRAELSKRRS